MKVFIGSIEFDVAVCFVVQICGRLPTLVVCKKLAISFKVLLSCGSYGCFIAMLTPCLFLLCDTSACFQVLLGCNSKPIFSPFA